MSFHYAVLTQQIKNPECLDREINDLSSCKMKIYKLQIYNFGLAG